MPIDVHWVTAFLDVAPDRFDEAAAFWTAVTDTTLSSRRGDRAQYATLEPAEGDASLRIQALDGPPRVHVDLHVSSLDDAQMAAMRLGATLVDALGHRIMRSPAGITFCFVGVQGQSNPSPAIPEPAPHRVDQLCLDVPADRFEAEAAFWSELLGFTWKPFVDFPDFGRLVGGEGLPFDFLLQRLGADDTRGHGDVHLDISCGPGRRAVVDHHARLGAAIVGEGAEWTVMRGPAGQVYCLTDHPHDAGVG